MYARVFTCKKTVHFVAGFLSSDFFYVISIVKEVAFTNMTAAS